MYNSFVVLYSFIILLILILMFASISLLGNFVSNNKLFPNNPFAAWIMGTIIYFFITFFVFFPFVFFEINIIYFAIIFFIKEFFLYLFFVLQREKINKIMWNSIIWIIISGIILTIIYKYGLVHFTQPSQTHIEKDFQSWIKFKNVIKHISQIPINILEDWLFSIIAATTAYAAITALIVELSKNHNYIEKIISGFFTLISLTFFSLGFSLHHSIGIYLAMFLVAISTRIIMYSRRRYGFLYGATSIVIWSFESQLFFAIFSLAFITLIIYGFLEKPKPSLFWVQLMIPNIILLSLQISYISKLIVLATIILSSILYFGFIFIGKNKWLDKLNQTIIKGRFIIPIFVLLIIVISSIVWIVQNKANWQNNEIIYNPIFSNNKTYDVWNIVQLFGYLIITSTLFSFLIYWLITKSKTTKINILFVIFSLTILFFYNPLVNFILQTKPWNNQLKFLKSILWIPMGILGLTQITKLWKKIFRT